MRTSLKRTIRKYIIHYKEVYDQMYKDELEYFNEEWDEINYDSEDAEEDRYFNDHSNEYYESYE